jgi:hypothetical protein
MLRFAVLTVQGHALGQQEVLLIDAKDHDEAERLVKAQGYHTVAVSVACEQPTRIARWLRW